MLSLVTLLAPPDPGQLKEQPLPLGQEYCHSNAISSPLGYEGSALALFPSWAQREDAEQVSSAAATINSQKRFVLIFILPNNNWFPPTTPINVESLQALLTRSGTVELRRSEEASPSAICGRRRRRCAGEKIGEVLKYLLFVVFRLNPPSSLV